MVKRSENIFHILTKESLICKDVFLFNLSKSFSIFDCPFEALEAIKDGHAISSKYNSSNLNFKTPNTVMVFSNKLPFTNALSSDRWQIFRIVNNHLVATDCTNKSSFSKISKNESSDELDESDEELNEKSDSSSLNSKNEKFNDPNSYRRVKLKNGEFWDIPIMPLNCQNCDEKFFGYTSLHKHTLEKHKNS